MVSADVLRSTAGAADATFTFSAPAHYVAQVAAFKAATNPAYLQGATATSNTAATSIAQAFAAPVSAGSLLVAAVAWTGTAPLTVTDSQGNSYAVAVTAYDAVLGQSLGDRLRGQRRAGTTTVTAGFGALSPAVRRLELHEYSGIATTAPSMGPRPTAARGQRPRTASPAARRRRRRPHRRPTAATRSPPWLVMRRAIPQPRCPSP